MTKEKIDQAINLLKEISKSYKGIDTNTLVYWSNVANELKYYKEDHYGKKVK